MTRYQILLAQFARANPEVIISERAIHPAGLWFEERQMNPTLDEVKNLDDLEPRIIGFAHLPTLIRMTALLTDDDFLVFVKTVGHIVDVVWDVTAGGMPHFWDPPDWEAVRKTIVEENIAHALVMVAYPFSG